MTYQVSRNGQMYGPYTLEDLQRYVASGNVLLTDLARSEEMPDWLPVAQILGTSPLGAAGAPAATPAHPTPAAYPQQPGVAYPDPPNLNWGLARSKSCGQSLHPPRLKSNARLRCHADGKISLPIASAFA